MIRNFFLEHKQLIITILAVKIAFAVILVVTYPLISFSDFDYATNGYQYSGARDALSRSLAAYDGQWYLHIAQHGYRNFLTEELHQKSYAFFPLYPLLIALFTPIFAGSALFAALAISFVCTMIGALLLYRMALLDLSQRAAQRTVWYFLIFPSAIFFSVVYTEALFFALSLASIYAARQSRFGRAGIWAYFAALTRPQGILLLVPLVIEWWQQYGSNKNVVEGIKKIPLAIAPLFGFATYYMYVSLSTGNPAAYFQFNASGWGREMRSPIDAVILFWERLGQFFSMPFHSFHYSQLDVMVTLVFLAMMIPILRRFRLSYATYAILLLVFPLMTGSTMSMTRYVAVSFPHMLLFGIMGTKRKWAHIAITLFSIYLSILLGIRFVHWYWAG